METNQNQPLDADQKTAEINKRKESAKFLKIYMFTFFIVVITLISLSYYAQERLSTKIEELTIEVGTREQEVISHMNNAENLQDFADNQAGLIQGYKTQLQDLENEIYDKNEQLDFYQSIFDLNHNFNEQNYTECAEILKNIVFLKTLSTNDFYDNYNYILTELTENEEIVQLFTAEQIEELKNLKK